MKPKFTEAIFWDVDYATINWEDNSRFVIERVLNRGQLSDWLTLQELYGLQRIKQEVVQIRDLNKKAHSFLAVILQIPKEKFRCYTQKQLNQGLWNY